jgi:hypothetical protein
VDVLVELIIGLLKMLFGEREEPADMSRRPRGDQRGARGPYNYGEGGTTLPSSGQPKTLEEILEEVRRQSAAKQGGAPRTPPPSNPPPPMTAGPRPLASTPAQQRRAASESAPATQPPRRSTLVESMPSGKPLVERERAAPQPIQEIQAERRERPQAIETAGKYVPTELVATEALPSEVKQGPRPIPPQQAARELGKLKGGLVASADTTVEKLAPVASQLELMRALRKATPKQRLAIVRQAFVFNEVFGSPRARRPHVICAPLLPGRSAPDAAPSAQPN